MNNIVFGAPVHILGEARLNHCPTDEWMFPSVISSAPFPEPTLGRWYMYYSPHDPPGGICLAYADHPAGPWTEHGDNPLIGNEWSPHYNVSHVASPHPLWVEEKNQMFLWFHGENDTTRYASSPDGIRFRYEGVAISATDKPELTVMSYARVFWDPDRASRYRFVMLYTGNATDRCCIYVARSENAHDWVLDEMPLIVPLDRFGQNTACPWLCRVGGELTVLHHTDQFVGDPKRFDPSGNFHATRVSGDLRQALGTNVFYKSQTEAPDHGRVADIQILRDAGRVWMFYTGGRRLRGRIYAREVEGVGIEQTAAP